MAPSYGFVGRGSVHAGNRHVQEPQIDPELRPVMHEVIDYHEAHQQRARLRYEHARAQACCFGLREVGPLQSDHDRRRRAAPPTHCRARDTEIRGDGQVPSALDKIPEPMVIALRRAGGGLAMRMIIGRSLTPLNLR